MTHYEEESIDDKHFPPSTQDLAPQHSILLPPEPIGPEQVDNDCGTGADAG